MISRRSFLRFLAGAAAAAPAACNVRDVEVKPVEPEPPAASPPPPPNASTAFCGANFADGPSCSDCGGIMEPQGSIAPAFAWRCSHCGNRAYAAAIVEDGHEVRAGQPIGLNARGRVIPLT